MNGLIYDFKRFAIHDGPGIRSTIFFKGCPLNCSWCHNPESRKACSEPQTSPPLRKYRGLFSPEENTIGKNLTIEELVTEVLKDRDFFAESGGGVTCSGGEPLLQPEFLGALLKRLRDEGIHSAVDTTGYADGDVFEQIISLTDLFLFDIKLIDPEKHKRYTGVSNRRIFDNLARIGGRTEVRIRIPLIPGITDLEENIRDIIDFIQKNNYQYPVDLLPYNPMGKSKYDRLGMTWDDSVKSENAMPLDKIRAMFMQAGLLTVGE